MDRQACTSGRIYKAVHIAVKKITDVYKFIGLQLVHREPILWDVRDETYKLSERKPAKWLAIADECGTDISKLCDLQ